MKKPILFFLLFLSVHFIDAQDKKDKNLVQFCNTGTRVFLDSLDKCIQLETTEPGLKIMSFHIKFMISDKQEKSFNVLGNELTPEIIRLFKEHYRSINDIYIDNVMAEKDATFLKLPPVRLMFAW
jgi:hypothetical protein